MDSQNEKLQQVSQQPAQGSVVAYSLVTRNRTPIVAPGKTLEIEVFLSGKGRPDKNKVHIQWSSPYAIDSDDSGNVTTSIAHHINPDTGLMELLNGNKWLHTQPIKAPGVMINLDAGFFMEKVIEDQPQETPKWVIRQVACEVTHDGNPPILLRLNTVENALPGDYEVTFVFTYGKEQELKQDYKAVPFHISSWWERNQWWIFLLTGVFALGSLLLTVVWYLTHW